MRLLCHGCSQPSIDQPRGFFYPTTEYDRRPDGSGEYLGRGRPRIYPEEAAARPRSSGLIQRPCNWLQGASIWMPDGMRRRLAANPAPLAAVAPILPIFRFSAIASRQGVRRALPTFDDLGQVHDMAN
jgi:hypothetical protein